MRKLAAPAQAPESLAILPPDPQPATSHGASSPAVSPPGQSDVSGAQLIEDEPPPPPRRVAQTPPSPPPPPSAEATAPEVESFEMETPRAGRSAASIARQRAALRRDRKKRQRGPLVLMILVTLLLAGAVGFGAWYVLRKREAPQAPARLDPELPVIPVERLGPAKWAPVGEELYVPSRHEGPIKLNGDQHLPAGGGGEFSAELSIDSNEVFESALIVLSAVDDRDTVFARTEVPLELLSSAREREIRVPIPANVYERVRRVDWRIEPGPTLRDAVLFDKAWVEGEPSTIANRTTVTVMAYNPLTTQTLQRAIFVLTAYGIPGEDNRDKVIGQFSVGWNTRIEAKQPVRFNAIVPVKHSEVVRWEVVGAGVIAK